MTMEFIEITSILDMAEEKLQQADVLRKNYKKALMREDSSFPLTMIEGWADKADELESDADELLALEIAFS